MPLNKVTLRATLKTALLVAYNNAKNAAASNPTYTDDQFATDKAQAIADAVIDHITANALVSTTVTGTAGTIPVTGTGTGGVT